MCGHSVQIMEQHYRELATPLTEQWFSVMPAVSRDNLVRFKALA
jgi:hypothetical protein